MGARKCSRHYMAKDGTESLYQNQTSVKQVAALPNLSLLALGLLFGTGWTLPRGALPHDVACREWAQPPRAEHTLARAHREQTAAMLRAWEGQSACTHLWATPRPHSQTGSSTDASPHCGPAAAAAGDSVSWRLQAPSAASHSYSQC